MFYFDNNYSKINEMLGGKTIKRVYSSSNRMEITFEDESTLTIDYVEYDGLDVRLYGQG